MWFLRPQELFKLCILQHGTQLSTEYLHNFFSFPYSRSESGVDV